MNRCELIKLIYPSGKISGEKPMRTICRRTAYAGSYAFGAQRTWPDCWLDPVANDPEPDVYQNHNLAVGSSKLIGRAITEYAIAAEPRGFSASRCQATSVGRMRDLGSVLALYRTQFPK